MPDVQVKGHFVWKIHPQATRCSTQPPKWLATLAVTVFWIWQCAWVSIKSIFFRLQLDRLDWIMGDDDKQKFYSGPCQWFIRKCRSVCLSWL